MQVVWRFIAVVAVAGATVAGIWAYTTRPDVNFLANDSGAEWVVFPLAADAHTRPVVEADTVFRRTFNLETAPRAAQLKVRAARRVELRINGKIVDVPRPENWKKAVAVTITELNAGANVIEARVFNAGAMPALWFRMESDGTVVRSDAAWDAQFMGSSWRNAILATTPPVPRAGNLLATNASTTAAAAKVWPAWLAMGAIAFAVSWWATARRTPEQLSQREGIILLGFVAALWVALFCNNMALLSPLTGFDANSHLDYIKYVQQRRALPLPNEGYSMFHPPLYYMVAAALLSLSGSSVGETSAPIVLRSLSMLCGIAQFCFAYLSLRLLFPRKLYVQLVGLLFAAVLPMQLYLSHYVTNEMFAATLSSAALYVALGVLKKNAASPAWRYALLGALLGAALLSKVTGAVITTAVLVTLTATAVVRGYGVAGWLRTVALTAVVAFAVCGWHYIRIWSHFGTPVVGNWDKAVGFLWWQDPGYHTAGDYVRFGRALLHPSFSGFASVADGIYSTLWGDGLWGGADVMAPPPWNYALMTGGYLLAIGTTLLMAAGAGVSFYKAFRKPSAHVVLLFLFSYLMCVAIVLITLRIPSYAQVKAFYAMSALLPIAIALATGASVIARTRFVRIIVTTFLLTWASNSFASFWIVRSTEEQHLYAAQHLRVAKDLAGARRHVSEALRISPASARAHVAFAEVLVDSGETAQAVQEARRAIELDAADSDAWRTLASLLYIQGDANGAIAAATESLRLGSENAFAHSVILNALLGAARFEEAMAAARDAIVVVPFSPDLHYLLAIAAAQTNDFRTAAEQFGYAMLLRPDWAEAREKLEWSKTRAAAEPVPRP